MMKPKNPFDFDFGATHSYGVKPPAASPYGPGESYPTQDWTDITVPGPAEFGGPQDWTDITVPGDDMWIPTPSSNPTVTRSAPKFSGMGSPIADLRALMGVFNPTVTRSAPKFSGMGSPIADLRALMGVFNPTAQQVRTQPVARTTPTNFAVPRVVDPVTQTGDSVFPKQDWMPTPARAKPAPTPVRTPVRSATQTRAPAASQNPLSLMNLMNMLRQKKPTTTAPTRNLPPMNLAGWLR